MKWYIPTAHGDIELTSLGVGKTRLRAFHLTPTEEAAMKVLRHHALGRVRPWATEQAFLPLDTSTYRDSDEGVTVELAAGLHEVSAVLSRPLKPARKLLHAVRFTDGAIEEVWGTPEERAQAQAEATEAPEEGALRTIEEVVKEDAPAEQVHASKAYREAPPTETVPTAPTAKKPAPEQARPESPSEGSQGLRGAPKARDPGAARKEKKAKAGVTVAAPTIGCPMPDFARAEVRATRVLEAFLDPEQLEDYRAEGRFMVVGADTGHRYLLAHREQPHLLAQMGGRQVFDLDAGFPICVHDWTVPAAEELLTLKLMLTLPGNERYVRSLTEAYL